LPKDIFISESISIKEALKKLDKTAKKVLLVVDNEEKLLGTITDGDIRRFILKGKYDLNNSIKNIYSKEPIYINKAQFSMKIIKKLLTENKVDLIPITNNEKKVIDFISWDQAFSENKSQENLTLKLDVPVIIMAGGKGTRLEPFTRVLPKPLIPIGEKTILETIIERFRKQGIKNFYLTLNYKGEMIEAYFKSIKKDFNLKYLWETNFLGTAGSLRLAASYIKDFFIVSNCDVLVDVNIEDILKLHKDKNSYLTILSSIQHYKLPYGIVKFKEEGEVTEILEKPEYTYTINTGVYILNKQVLDYIPDNTFFDMTDLIHKLLKSNKKVITYPINESDYIDIGQWEEYKKSISKMNLIV
jgi:dTDP-glucose pyrophosphorylase